MALRLVNSPWIADTFQTTDATPTTSTVAGYTVPSGAVGLAELRFIGRDSAGNGVTAYVCYPFQNIAGTVTLGTVNALAAVNAIGAVLAAALVDMVVSGTAIRPRVTGIIATTINWQIDARYSAN